MSSTVGKRFYPYVVLGAIIVSIALLLPVSGHAQYYFGKNKVQYTTFDWQVMATEHFRIYFYKDELEIAQIAAHTAEAAYRELAAKFNHEVRHTIPLIIYSSPSYFAQTNVTSGLVGESVGGFTEFLKGRVVVPFHGSYFDFEHVIRHEMVHVFQIDKLEYIASRVSNRQMGYPPLWFTEGLAEFWSKEWDTEADMIIKDLVIDGNLLPIDRLYIVQGTYFMYKLGESVCKFIDSTYGPDKIVQIYENWPKGKSFEEVVEVTLGESINEVSRKWEYSLMKKYFPEVKDLGLPKMESEQVSPRGYAVKGVTIRWDSGNGPKDHVIFMANRMGYTGLYMQEIGSEKLHTLVKGERSSKFESLYLLRSGIDANDSGLVVFASKSKETDKIYLYDIREREVTREYRFDDLISARSPQFSPDGKQVIFSGVRTSGFADLYLLELSSGDYRPLMDDIYYDTDPTFSHDGKSILFASDRCEHGKTGSLNIFSLDPLSNQIEQLTFGPYHDQTPESVENGIYFSSDREGSYNLFLLANDGTLSRQSTYVTGAFDPRMNHDGTQLLYTGYQDQGFQIYQMTLPEYSEPLPHPPDTATLAWTPVSISKEITDASISYDADYSFDIAQSNVGYDPVYGSAGGFQGMVSDILGNKAYYLFLSNTSNNKDDFLTSFNVGVTYINRTHRMNWGVGIYHLFDEYYNDYDLYYDERQVGGVGLVSYPFSKFSRFELTTSVRYSKKDLGYSREPREAILGSNYLTYIYDNSLWDISGPIEGRRYNFTIGHTGSISDFQSFSRMGFADIRHYFRLGQNSAFANRLFGYASAGIEPQRAYLGGSWSFRGFKRNYWYSKNILFASNELRFPLVDDLVIGLPFGGMAFRGIRGVLFFDTGAAWDDEFDQFYGSFGAGFRVNLGYIVQLRFDFARTTDFESISPRTDFDFFFGWNF